MCTVTWWHGEGGAFSVFFNRDELRSRAPSQPVEEGMTATGMRFLAPRDPVAGGTWLLANATGVVVGVLNHYAAPAGTPAPPVRSRGELPLAYADCRTRGEVALAAQQLRVREYAPFILLAWDEAGASGWLWDGRAFASMGPLVPPVTTSSHRSGDVRRWRCERYAAVVPTGSRDELMAFQDDVAYPDPAFNVRMRRPDARTESVCQVDVTAAEVRFRHRRESPDAIGALDTTTAAVVRN